MKCKHCGSDIKIGQRFCYNCSMPIDYDIKTAALLEEQQEKKEKEKIRRIRIRKINKIFMFVLSVSIISYVFHEIFWDNKGFTVDKVVNVVENIKEVNKLVETSVDDGEETEGYFVEIGEGCSSISYEIELLDVEIIDKSYDRAILYNFRNNEEYVFIKVSIFNKSYEDAIYSSLYNFKGVCDGIDVNQSKSGTLAEGNTFISIDGLNYRRSTKIGFICYSLPEGWKDLRLYVNIDGIENEPVLLIENPKNRVISNEEIEQIIEYCNIEDYLMEIHLSYISDEELYSAIIDFMHQNCLNKTDKVSSSALKSYLIGVLKS